MKSIILATLAGATIAFTWNFVSWQFLPWHQMETFENDDAVARVITENAPTHGVYTLPRHLDQKLIKAPHARALTRGPFLYAIIRPDPLTHPWSLSRHLIYAFCIQVIGAFLITLSIHRIRASRYISRASVGPTMGLFAGLMMTLPQWNGFELPQSHTLAQILDPLIAWSLAGLVIAAMIKPRRARRIFS
ncbi:MAG: hypothetical protein KJO21_11385 [Verrucomicrobiae bacterium]|nr:hypothetical protein [Verrucomicrobiae bacterium]NNJ42890.1 hypothetical protein [Akkermansiaceae bacterium]